MAKAPEKAAPPIRMVGVVFNVSWRGYNTGEQAGFPLPIAQSLLAKGDDGRSICSLQRGEAPVPRAAPPEPNAEDQDVARAEHDAKIARIVDLMENLDPNNKRYWDEKTGIPSPDALSKLHGSEVTEAERDEAWAIVLVKRSEAEAQKGTRKAR